VRVAVMVAVLILRHADSTLGRLNGAESSCSSILVAEACKKRPQNRRSEDPVCRSSHDRSCS